MFETPIMNMVKELKKMNDRLTDQLNQIVQRLDILIEMERTNARNSTS